MVEGQGLRALRNRDACVAEEGTSLPRAFLPLPRYAPGTAPAMDTLTFLRTIRALADGEEAYFAALEGAAGFEPVAYAEVLDRQRLMPWVEPAITGEVGRRRLPASLGAAVRAGSAMRRMRTKEGIEQRIEIHVCCVKQLLPRSRRSRH